MSRALRILLPCGAAILLGGLVWLVFGRVGFVNYDSAWSLNWMRELLAGGSRPDLTVPFSPTPHPLSDLFSGLLTPWSDAGGVPVQTTSTPPGLPAVFGPTGQDAEGALVAFAMFWIGALGVVTFRLGRAWFGPAAGVLAAVLLLTREPVLSYGLRTYLDLPYAVFLLLALLAETHRPRNGARTLAWITLAGLLRPEAWLLAGAYVAYLWWWRVRESDAGRGAAPPAAPPSLVARLLAGLRPLWPLVALAAIAPLGWIVEGVVLTGDPLQALTGTQENAESLGRDTGLRAAIELTPRRLGEIVREPVLFAALGGALLALRFRRRDALLPVASLVAALGAFAILGTVGLPLLTRYLVFPAALVVLLATAGLLGWQRLAPGHRARRPWQAFAAVALLFLVVFGPAQADRLDRLQAALHLQERVIDDLRTTVGDVVAPAITDERCSTVVALPNHRAVPQVRLWAGRHAGDNAARGTTLEVTTMALAAASDRPAAHRAIVLLPVSEKIARGFILDKADQSRALPAPPAGSIDTGAVGAWRVLSTDPACAKVLKALQARR